MKILLICNYKPGVGGISGQVEILQRKLREEGLLTEIFTTKGSVFWRLGLVSRLQRVAQDYDILHIHCCSGWGFLPAVIGITVGQRLKKRIVLTYHGGGGEKFFDRHPWLVHYYLTRTDANIVLSGFLAKIFDRRGLQYAVIPNIVELDENMFRKRELLNPRFICTRAHEPLYNIPCILRAFRLVQTKKPESSLTLVGDGSQHEELVAMVKEMNLKNVLFIGRVDNSEIYRYLDQADILLSAPTIDNMPVSIMEAMNVGLLVISSRVGGVPFIIDNNCTGLLFESNNPEELAEKMLYAVDHPAESISIIEQAHKAVDAYRWGNTREKLYRAYGLSA